MHFIFHLSTLASMRLDFQMFQYSSRAKIPIHHGARTDRMGRIDKKQAYILNAVNVIMNNISAYDCLDASEYW